MKKILQLCAYAAPYEGNFVRSLIALEKDLKRYEFETIYVFPESTESYSWCKQIQKNNQVYFLPVFKTCLRLKTYKILRKIFAKNPDIKIAHSHFECFDIPLKIVAPRSVKIFWHLHDAINIGYGLRRFIRWLHYGFFSRNVKLLSVSECKRKELVELGFNENNTETILNGIDLERISDCSFGEKCVDIITFGWDFYRKGVDIILKACKLLIEEKKINLNIVINGNCATSIMMHNFFPEGIPKCIVFQEFCDDINELFLRSKIFVQASRAETFSYAVAEAAFAGLKVISSDIPGLEWAHEVPSVSFFESENVQALALEIEKKLKENLKESVVSESRRIISLKYSVACWVQNIEKAYQIF